MRFDTQEHFGEPVRVGNLTVTPVAKSRFMALDAAGVALVRLQTHPDRLEVKSDDGTHWKVPINDVESRLLGAVAGGAALLRFVIKAIRKRSN